MSMQLSNTDAHGHVDAAAYHKITEMRSNFVTNEYVLFVSTYKDKAAEEAGKQPITERHYTISGTDFDIYMAATVLEKAGNSPRKRAYTYLMTEKPDFAGAIEL